MSWQVIEGDCVEELARLDEVSVDAIVADPPYGLEFMGKEWDRLWRRAANPADVDRDTPHGRASRTSPEYVAGVAAQEWHRAWATEALRVLKPGGHLLAFGGTRTYHRLACAVEDAGFEIRDSLIWLYGSGFPKSLDVSKAIDKAAGAEREERTDPRWEERYPNGPGGNHNRGVIYGAAESVLGRKLTTSDPATPEAAQWQGWGTALKPGHEPIVVARKPLTGTVAANVLEHGTGAINVDGCRIESGPDYTDLDVVQGLGDPTSFNPRSEPSKFQPASGRWPANVILSPEAAEELDEQSGELPGRGNVGATQQTREDDHLYHQNGSRYHDEAHWHDKRGGGASRFFYVAKASRAERNAGLEGFEERPVGGQLGQQDGKRMGRSADEGANTRESVGRNVHPTVKPLNLMRWLVRLVTPPGGTVLDPFLGSGTTGCAAALEGFDFIGIERGAEYVEIAKARIDYWNRQPVQLDLETGGTIDRCPGRT